MKKENIILNKVKNKFGVTSKSASEFLLLLSFLDKDTCLNTEVGTVEMIREGEFKVILDESHVEDLIDKWIVEDTHDPISGIFKSSNH